MARLWTVVVFLGVTALWAALLPRLHVTTSITEFMPDAADRRAAHLLRAIAEGESSRTLVLDVSGDEPDRLATTTLALLAALRSHPGITSARSGLDDDEVARVGALLASRSPTAFLDPADLDDAAIHERLGNLRARLASPLAPVVRPLATRDPLGGTIDALEELARGSGKLTTRGGVVFTADERHALAFVVTKESAFDAPAQRAHLEWMEEAFRAARGSPRERLELSGIARFAIASEAQIRTDIERIGTISTAGILLLFALLFRSFRMVALALVPLWVGTATATLVCAAIFGEVHALTLAFGTSLLGVGIDYAEHYFAHYALDPDAGPTGVMRSVWPGLWMGGLTTIVGFAALAGAGLPGVRQIGVFSAVAIVASLCATRWLLPPWMPRPYARPALMGWIEALARRVTARATRLRWLLFAPAVLVLALVPAIARAQFVDDLSTLIALDPKIVAEDEAVRARSVPADPGRFAVVVRKDPEEALVALERTTKALDEAKRAGKIDGYLTVGSLVRSRARQQASFARAKARREALESALAAEGFLPAAFAPFFAALDEPAPVLLGLDDLRASPLGTAMGSLAPRLAEGQAFILPLVGVRDARALGELVPDAVVIDETTLLESASRDARRGTAAMLGLGALFIVGTLLLRYRSPRLVLAAIVPAALGGAAAIGAIAALGGALNLLHVLGLLLVLAMGTDFGIFVVEGRKSVDESAHSLVSIVTATSTTLLSFGLLGLSPSPALRALGSTIAIGLTATMLICPLGVVFVARERRE